MGFRTYQPVPPLCCYIENLWLYNGFESPRLKERIFPSGTFELVFNLRDDEFRVYKSNNPHQPQRFCGAIFSGPYAGYFLADTEEESSVMGVHFRPGGAFPFLRECTHEYADTHVDIQTTWGAAANEIREQMSETESPIRRFRLLEKWLLSRFIPAREHHAAVSLALDAFAFSQGQMTRELARQAGLSEKRFIDVFRFEVGMRPKLFSRIQRFQKVIAALERNRELDWAQLAFDCGYFDQSHLIRDFQAFSGLSPSDYVLRLGELHRQGLRVKFNHLPLAA